MPVTMRDVARRAGVSVKTVSNVVNDYPFIRDSTRDRVLEAIDALGYQMNLKARNLRSGRTGIIALAVPELSLPYFAELADAVISAAERHGLTVLIEQTNAVRERELAALSSARAHLVDGLLFSPLALGPADAAQLSTALPTVLLGERIFHGPVDHVMIDNVNGSRAATEHLISTGRRRIAVIGTHPGEEVGTAAIRYEAAATAMREAGLRPLRSLAAPAGLWHRDTGAAAMLRLLRSGRRIDAVFALNDTLALGAMRVLVRSGVRVPDDIALVGFDDIEEARYSTPTLTSVNPSRGEIARMAVELLVERMAGRAGAHEEIVAPYRLNVRESTLGVSTPADLGPDPTAAGF